MLSDCKSPILHHNNKRNVIRTSIHTGQHQPKGGQRFLWIADLYPAKHKYIVARGAHLLTVTNTFQEVV